MKKAFAFALPFLALMLGAPGTTLASDHVDGLKTALDKIVATRKRRIGFVGLSFKTGTDDLRESPLVSLAEQLIGKGMELAIYDPEVRLSQLLGANRRYIEQHLPHIGALLEADLANVIRRSDVLVVGMGSDAIADELTRHLQPHQVIVDLVRLPRRTALVGQVQGLCW